MHRIQRRPFLLLEVLIAFAIVVLCVLPFLGANAFMTVTEKKFLEDVEIDRIVNVQLVTLLEKLYKNEIPWTSLMEGTQGTLNTPSKIPFETRYSIKLNPKEKEGNENITYHKVDIALSLVPKDQKRPPLIFSYQFFVEHLITYGKLPAENAPTESKPPPPQQEKSEK